MNDPTQSLRTTIYAVMLYAALVMNAFSAQPERKEILTGVWREYEPISFTLPKIEAIAIFPCDEMTAKGVYATAEMTKELESISGMKVTSAREVTKLLGKEEVDLAGATDSDIEKMLAGAAKATGSNVLLVRQLHEMSKRSSYQVVRVKETLGFDLEIDLYDVVQSAMRKQKLSVDVAFGVSAFSKSKVTEAQIRAALARDIKERILMVAQ